MYRFAAGLLALMMWLAVPAVVTAHTGVAVSSPADGEVVAEELKQVDMTFTTTFEKALSKATLTNEAGAEVPYAELIQENKTMSMRFDEPLPSGAYTVNWNLIGEDGHAVKGQYAFSVKLDESAAEEQAAEPESPAVDPPTTDDAGAESDNAGDATEEQPVPGDANGAPLADADEDAAQAEAEAAAPAASTSMLGTGGMIAVIAGIAVLALLIIRSLRKQ